MNTRVFTGPGQNGDSPSVRILAIVKACPGISLALLCRALNGQPSTEWCGLCDGFANSRKRRRAELEKIKLFSGEPGCVPGNKAGSQLQETLPTPIVDLPHQLHNPCPGLGFDNVRKSVYALAERGLLRLERERRQDPRQPRGWDWMSCCYYQPAAHMALIGCVSQKLDRPAPARELYTSPLWKWRLTWAEGHADRVLVLSAGYHLVELDQVLQPYDASLNTASKEERLAWSATVWTQLHQTVDVAHTRFTLLAGKAYVTYLRQWLRAAAAGCEIPLQGLSIGQQLQWLKRETEHGK